MVHAAVRFWGVRTLLACAFAAGLVHLLPAATARAVPLTVNVETDGTVLGGIAFAQSDVVLYDPVADSAALLLPATAFNKPTRVDAYHLLDDGTMVLSTAQSKRTIGGLTVDKGDIVLYDPIADTASLLLSESAFDKSTNVDAVFLMDDGTIALSIQQDDRTLGGLTFNNGDIVLYDPDTDSATLLFSESLFGGDDVDIDAIYIAPDGSIYLSTVEDGVTLGGLTFDGDDIVLYNSGTDTAVLYSDGSLLPPGVDNPHIGVPEPPAVALLLSGLVGLVAFPRLSRGRGRGRGGGR
jgi:hypothetical protein